jgi:DNA-binding PadR family transcriptional regulator
MTGVDLPLSTDFVLLGFLGGQSLGSTELYHQLSSPAGLEPIWPVKQSQLCGLLVRLERDGYVTTTLEPPNGHGKTYQLTGVGREVFLDWVRRPVRHGRELRLDFLVKLYFAQREGPEVAARLLEEQRLVCWAGCSNKSERWRE